MKTTGYVKPRVAVLGYMNETGDSSFNIPTDTATEILMFSLKLLNRFEAVEADDVIDDVSDAGLADYCASRGCDYVLCGALTKDVDGTQTYKLWLFDNGKGVTTARETARGESVMDVFDIADRLSASVLDVIAGRKLTFGSLKFTNIGKPVDYDVFVDGGHTANDRHGIRNRRYV